MIYILLPAYNEEEGIEKLLERLIRITKTFLPNYKIIIVNDGSTDHTRQIVDCFKNKLNIEIVSFETNKGIVDVFLTGFKKVCADGKDDDICITMDSDNTQNPIVILDIVEKIKHSYDIVIASRFAKGGQVVGLPWFRKFLSNGVALMMQNLARVPAVKDYSTFYRGVRVRILKDAFAKYHDNLIQGHGFSGMARLLVKLSDFTDKFAEVPLTIRYDLKEGGSGMRFLKTIQGYLILFYDILRDR